MDTQEAGDKVEEGCDEPSRGRSGKRLRDSDCAVDGYPSSVAMRRGGAVDCAPTRPPQPWELADGSVTSLISSGLRYIC